jgi:uncharacterized damage-inducible protein DinB
MDNETDHVRRHVIALLRGGHAYDTFEQIVGDFPVNLRGVVPSGAERSPWQVLAHMQITQADILDFCMNPNYKELDWPDEYWPREAAPPQEDSWGGAVSMYLDDRKAIERLVLDESCDLYAPLPWGDGQTLLREALLVADHQSYHLGQLVVLRRLVG